MTRHRYRVHQRPLESDCVLPYLPPQQDDSPAKMTLTLLQRRPAPSNREPWHRGIHADSTSIEMAGDTFVMRFVDGTEFVVDAGGTTIQLASAPTHYTIGDLAAYALGPVLALALHLQGAVLLHASAVVIHDKAVLFAGAAGRGKSTTAAILARQGRQILADDLTEVTSSTPHCVIPSTGVLRLWDETLTSLYGAGAAFPDRAPSWDKKILQFDETSARPEIGAILFLSGNERSLEPSFDPISPKLAWTRLIADSFTAMLPDRRMTKKIFEVTSSLANTIPSYDFTAPVMSAASTLDTCIESLLSADTR